MRRARENCRARDWQFGSAVIRALKSEKQETDQQCIAGGKHCHRLTVIRCETTKRKQKKHSNLFLDCSEDNGDIFNIALKL
jgi:hypothetical protein